MTFCGAYKRGGGVRTGKTAQICIWRKRERKQLRTIRREKINQRPKAASCAKGRGCAKKRGLRWGKVTGVQMSKEVKPREVVTQKTARRQIFDPDVTSGKENFRG